VLPNVFRNLNKMNILMCKRNKWIATVWVFLTIILLFSTNVFAIQNAADDAPENTEKNTITPAGKKPEEAKALAGNRLSNPDMASNLVQTTLGLLLVLLVIGAAAWAFKRFGNVHVGAQGRMKIIGGISLGTRERAVLLQVGEQQLVIGVSPGRVQTLHVLDKPVLIEDKPEKSTSFSSRLQSAILDRKGNVNGKGTQ